VILVHLGMTGRLGIAARAEVRPPHCHVVWSLRGERGAEPHGGVGRGGDAEARSEARGGQLAAALREELRFVDARRFGWVAAADDDAGLPELTQLGPDPLDELDLPGLASALSASSAPLKAFLLDQRRIVGIGNIYACEALFRARLHPALPARRAIRRAPALLAAIREVLELGIRNRGTSLRDYVDGDGRQGENQAALQVYGREGAPCAVCGADLRRIVQGGRSTFLCARCQRR
jgi:formamidopyrimidine-DNA glycosylase